MFEVAYVAALRREVAPLIEGWRFTQTAYSGRNFDFFEKGDRVLVCGGIGPEAARRATEAVVALYRPKEVVSVGFAGALVDSMRVGEISEPAVVVDTRDGSRTSTGRGVGTLVSFGSVAQTEQKQKLASAYGAQTVDMEAASVASGAKAHGLSFRAVKVVSDELQFAMPNMDRFIDATGSFRTPSFIAFAALRPATWPSLIRLARNSQRAAQALSERLQTELNPTIEIGGHI
jgi:adenosylhomocysteine nucleosidase